MKLSNRGSRCGIATSAIAVGTALLGAHPGMAQTEAGDDSVVENVANASPPSAVTEADGSDDAMIVVTGSYIARPIQDSLSPLDLIGEAEIESRGIQNVSDLLSVVSSNGLSKTYSDATGSPYTIGTSQVNLRGLGFSSTLTLINGRRQTLAPTPDTDGASFVDINPIPLIMIERMEVLKDGASAIYGSDAIAGVANFIMRERLDGIIIDGSVNSTFEDWQTDYHAGVAAGLSSGSFDLVVGAEYLHRSNLAQNERDFSADAVISSIGFPGSFLPVDGSGSFMIDPTCAELGGIPRPFSPAAPSIGFCGLDLSYALDLIAEEERVTSYLTANWQVSDDINVYAEGGYARTRVAARSSPSYLNTSFPVVPASNPGNIFGTDLFYFARPAGNPDAPATDRPQTYNTYRGVLGVEADLTDEWSVDTSVTYSQQDVYSVVPNDVLVDRFQAALNCMGGPNNDECFNPFGSALLDPALANSQSVIDDFTVDTFRDYRSSLFVGDIIFTGELAQLDGGPLTVALGGQFRRETLSFDADIPQQTGQLGFIFSGPSFEADRNFYAGFVELDMPISPRFTFNAAGRYEEIGGFGGTFNPKVSLRWEALDTLVLRGSIGTSFRAPSLSQITSISTINTAITDPLNPSPLPFFTLVGTVPNSDLEPETSTNFNLGAVWSPTPAIRVSLDYFNYHYEDLIVKQDAQSLVFDNPLDPRIQRLGATGPIQGVDVSFENAKSVFVDGIDIGLDWRTGIGSGDFAVTGRASYIMNYRADVGHGPNEQLAGFRNYQNFAPPVPHWRGSANARYSIGAHQFAATVNYVGPVRENFTNLNDPNYGFKIDSFTTLDLQYSLEIAPISTTLTAGVRNVLGEDPPPVILSNIELSGFARQLHDPRGTIGFVSLRTRF